MGKDSTKTKLFFNREVIPMDAMQGDGEEGDEPEVIKGKEDGKEQEKGKGKKRADCIDGNDITKKKVKS